jgi:hypothetical protein
MTKDDFGAGRDSDARQEGKQGCGEGRPPRRPESLARTRRHRRVAPEESEGGESSEQIGYGHPPKAHRFQEGQSGNPQGRPVGSKNKEPSAQRLRDLMLAEGDRPEAGELTCSRIEKIVRTLHDQAAAADVAAIKVLFHMRAAAEASRDEEARKAAASQASFRFSSAPPELRAYLSEGLRRLYAHQEAEDRQRKT